jgi:hypothetical protein
MDIRDLPGKWDIIVIGGGITGAGILREAVRAGLLLPSGGKQYLDRVQKICGPVLSWDESR